MRGFNQVEVQAAKVSALQAEAIVRGADLGSSATKCTKQAMADNDDVVLGALVLTVKSSVLETLDLDYKRLRAAAFPHAAAQFIKRTVDDPGVMQHCAATFAAISLVTGLHPIKAHAGKPVDSDGNTQLHLCAGDGGSGELAIELLNIGTPIESQNSAGCTALHVAAKSGNMAVAKALCESGANVMARSKTNRTPKMQVCDACWVSLDLITIEAYRHSAHCLAI